MMSLHRVPVVVLVTTALIGTGRRLGTRGSGRCSGEGGFIILLLLRLSLGSITGLWLACGGG